MEDLDLESEKRIYSLEALGIDVDKLYNGMGELEVGIDLAVAPDIVYINTKMVACREAAMKAQRTYLKIQRALGMNQKWLLNLETTFGILSDSKLENDAEVRSGASSADRTAMANNRLVNYKRAIKEAKNNVSILKALNKAIDLCISNIDKADNAIKQQARLMETQMKNLKTMDSSAAARDRYLSKTMEDMDSLDKMYDQTQTAESFAIVGTDDTAEVTVPEEAEASEESSDEEAVEETQEATVLEETTQVAEEIADTEALAVTEDLIGSESTGDSEVISIDDDEGFSLAPGLTGMPQAAEELVVAEEEPDSLTAFLDEIPSASSRKEAGEIKVPSSAEESSEESSSIDSSDEESLDDPLMNSILESFEEDVPTADLAALASDDIFGGLVETTVVTEQKIPKILAGQVEPKKKAEEKPAEIKPVAKAVKAEVAEKKATVAPSATPTTKTEAPKAAAPAQSIDDLMNDLGL